MFKNHKWPNLKLFCQSGFWLLGIKNHANNVGDSDDVALGFQKVGAAYRTFHTRPAAGFHETIPVVYTSWAKTTDQSCATRASDPLGDPAPPPYTEHDPQTARRASQNITPSYNRSTSKPKFNATTKFPPAINATSSGTDYKLSISGQPQVKSHMWSQHTQPFSATNPRSFSTTVELISTQY
jgi:hypothetical protein